MDVVDHLERAREDTRGLPPGFDPRYFYEYKIQTKITNASGIESFAYKYIPWALLKSFAFAIDPTGRFKVSPKSITAANRTKYRATASVLQTRGHERVRTQQSWAPIPNFNGVSNCWSPYMSYTPFSRLVVTGGFNSQPPLPEKLKDTTSRTRVIGSEQGELEMFKCNLNSPARTVRYGDEDEGIYDPGTYPPTDPCIVVAHGDAYRRNGGFEKYEDSIRPSAAVLSRVTFDALVAQEIDYTKALCQKYVVPMLKGVSPVKRDYTLFRNIVELRDYPRGVLQLKETIGNFRKLYVSLTSTPKLRNIIFDVKRTSKDIPKEYLSFHFGWKQTWKDALDLLEAPKKISKRINFLIERSGKPTTLRSTRKEESVVSDVSGFDYDVVGGEYAYSSSSRLVRSSTVRLVINATFDFPIANTPNFKRDDFLLRMGVVPNVTDVYNLTPWTWLVDWFTGFGNYLELIETINNDPSLINWGMITAVTDGELITDYQSKSDLRKHHNVFPAYESTIETITTVNKHASTLSYKCQTRSDLATILDVKLTSVPTSLSAFQKSILGALLAQRSSHSGRSPFRTHA